MAFLDRHPLLPRPLIGLLTLLFAAATVVTFVNYVSSPTDENIFSNLPAPMSLYVTKTVPGTFSPAAPAESLRVGDLVDAVGSRKVRSVADLDSVLSPLPPEAGVVVRAYRPAWGRFLDVGVLRKDIPDSCCVVVTDFIAVTEVTPGGASDRAGMKVGDLLFRINGKGFSDAQGAELILEQGQTGKTIIYEALRDNQHLTLNVTLAQFGIPLALLIVSLSGMFSMAVGAFIALKRPHLRAARSVGLFLLCLGFFIAVLAIRRDAVVTPFVIVRNMMVGLSLLCGVWFGGWAGLLFPRERTDLLAKRWILWGSLGCVVAGVVLSRLFTNSGALIGSAAVLLFFLLVQFVYRKGATAEHRRMGRVIRWTLLSVVAVSVGTFSYAANSARTSLILDLVAVMGVLLLAIPLAYLYTIGRYRLLDLEFRIKRNIQYSLVTVAWGVCMASVLLTVFVVLPRVDFHFPAIIIRGSSIEGVDDPSTASAREWTNRFLPMALGVIAWYILWRIRRRGQEWIDRKYYRTQYDYRRAVGELTKVLATKLSMADLGEGLTEKLAELVRVKRAGVFFFRGGAVSACRQARGLQEGEWSQFCSVVEAGLVPALASAGDQLQADYLPPAMKEAFRKHQFQLIVPVRSQDRLLGAMVLGEKLSEATYRREDYEFLASAAVQASVAMENAFLYEELAEKERMRHELEIARRIQLASLPQTTPVMAGLDISGASLPAMEVGGDFFDYLNGSQDRLTVVVGDVSGKGTSAALYMSKVQGILRSLHGFGLSPGDLFIRANRLLCGDLEKNSFVTAVGASFGAGTRSFVLARAGHLPLYHYRAAQGGVAVIIPRGLGLGLNNAGIFSSEIEEKVVTYREGDVLLFVTDGVTEASNMQGELYGEERLTELLVACASKSASAIRDCVLAEILSFAAGADQHDDETVVVVKAMK